MFLRKYWYIACASSQLGAAPRAARVLDQDIVVFRGDGRRPAALLDRCCHRGVKLSLGRVTGGALACGYHGWRFGGGGACVHIPSLAEGRRIPARCAVPAFPCVERDGYVWVWIGGEGDAAAPPPPGIDGFSARRWDQGSVDLECASTRGLENNLDWCHPAFAHPWTHGQFYLALLRGLREQLLEVRPTPDGMTVVGPISAAGGAPAPRSSQVLLSFTLPDRVEVRSLGGMPRRIVLHFVPTAPDRCRMEWLVSRALPFGPRVRFRAREPTILRQDRILLESAEPAYAGEGAFREQHVEADAPMLLLRRILGWAARGEWEARRASLPERRLIRVRA
ncbi:aromatic ring-hydroxylating dioxygenase subunit alpha [Sorangium sp. So ce1036]|uniref:Rieske 2Fe-2S domain-containing protein n=1 Tax=Sorangium sp. So ce1036 TaxID=3133328 RepID=UPI003EFC165A